MQLEEPILTKNIPTEPWGDRDKRRYVGYKGYVTKGGYEALEQSMGMKPKDIVESVKAAELRGRGGAGFSAGLKWTFLPPPDGEPRYLAVNADESEPGTFKDRLIIDFDPQSLLEGVIITMIACELDTAYIYIRGEYHKQAKTLQKAIKEAYDNGVFGQNARSGKINGRWPECYMHRGAGAYICGEETGMLESIEGKRGWPRIKPPFPAIEGLFARPTVINNVETIAMVPHIVQRGAEWFRSIGVPSRFGEHAPGSFGPKLFGISGMVNRPGVYELPLGVKMSEVIEEMCGGIKTGKKYKAAVPGGVAMGFLGADQYEAELDFDIGRAYNVLGLGTAGVIVIDEDTSMVSMTRNVVRFMSHESCGQCTPCREGSGWAYQLLCRIESGEGRFEDIDLLDEVAQSQGAMPGTTICGLADGTNWAVKTAIAKFRHEFEALCKPSLVQVGVKVGS
ncbi:MAG: NADH-quinone oxidoreductase subunit NuoF [Planctomycetota bacterium]